MSARNSYKYLMLLLVFFSCSKNQILQQPDISLGDVNFISDTSMKKMEGIYTLGSGSSALGTQFVCKASKYKVSFFSNAGGVFMILSYGLDPSDSSLKFSGFWRFSQVPTQGLINFTLPKADALAFLKTGDISATFHCRELFMIRIIMLLRSLYNSPGIFPLMPKQRPLKFILIMEYRQPPIRPLHKTLFWE